jgi:hypothetical protein
LPRAAQADRNALVAPVATCPEPRLQSPGLVCPRSVDADDAHEHSICFDTRMADLGGASATGGAHARFHAFAEVSERSGALGRLSHQHAKSCRLFENAHIHHALAELIGWQSQAVTTESYTTCKRACVLQNAVSRSAVFQKCGPGWRPRVGYSTYQSYLTRPIEF